MEIVHSTRKTQLKEGFLFFTLEAVVDAWRKVRRLQFPWQTNVFSAPLNSSFSRSAANSTFHDPSVRDRRKRLVACKAAFSASARKKGVSVSNFYGAKSARRQSRVVWSRSKDGTRHSREQVHSKSPEILCYSSLIYSVSELNFQQVLTECGYFVVELRKVSSLFASQISNLRSFEFARISFSNRRIFGIFGIFKYSNVRRSKVVLETLTIFNIEAFEFSTFSTFKSANIDRLEYRNIRIFKYATFRLFKFSIFLILAYTQ